MALFIKDINQEVYAVFSAGDRPSWWICAPNAFPSRYGAFFDVSEEDFTDGSTFCEASDMKDLDYCDCALGKNLHKGYIDPQGHYYGVRTHLAFYEHLLNTTAAQLLEDGWIEVGLVGNEEHNNIRYWRHYSQLPNFFIELTRGQLRTLERIGLNPLEPKIPPEYKSFEDVFGEDETRVMKLVRAEVAARLEGKFRQITAEEARTRITEAQSKLGIDPIQRRDLSL